MSQKLSVLILCLVALSACAHRGAVRVDCTGPLRPINRPVLVPTPAPNQTSEGRHEG